MTHYYEDLKVGQSESISHTVTERDVELFGEATGDCNPVHFDEAYARKTVFRGRVAHGALSIGYHLGGDRHQIAGRRARSSCPPPPTSRGRCGSATP